MECCSNPTYQEMFDDKSAKKELKRYKNKGVKRSTRPLIAMLNKLPVKAASLLDIGGGIGIISFELFKRGLANSTSVDISAAYAQTFQQEAARSGLADKIEAHTGDFLTIEQALPNADLVTLDKVICCYKDYQGLITSSVAKAKKWYIYTLPRDVWWVRWTQLIGQKVMKLSGSKFESFVHPVAEIEAIVTSNGFRKIDTRYNLQWMTVAYEKIS